MKLSSVNHKLPRVSLVMAVKDGEERIAQSVSSLLNQTYSDFELIIIDDGSVDRTVQIIRSFDDPRIFLYSQENKGVAISANRGLALARGEFIARQDHDDISKESRLEKQVAFLDSHPEIFLVGTAAEITNNVGFTGRYHAHPTDPDLLKLEILFDNPFVHSSIMFRREVIKNIGFYNPKKQITPLDDYDFISRIALKYKVANLSEPLVEYYESNNSLTSDLRDQNSTHFLELKKKKIQIMAKNISEILDYEKNFEIVLLFSTVFAQLKPMHKIYSSFNDMEDILLAIFKKINLSSHYHENLFRCKLDHLVHCWYEYPGVASSLEKLWRHICLSIRRIMYEKKIALRKTGSRIKKLLRIKRN